MLLGGHCQAPAVATMQKKFNTIALWVIVSILCIVVLLHYHKNNSFSYSIGRDYFGDKKEELSGTVKNMDQFYCINSKFQNAPEFFEVKTAKPADRSTTLGPCPDKPSSLVGPLNVDFHLSWTWSDIRKEVSAPLQDGGRYMPRDCFSQHKVGETAAFKLESKMNMMLNRNFLFRNVEEESFYDEDVNLPQVIFSTFFLIFLNIFLNYLLLFYFSGGGGY